MIIFHYFSYIDIVAGLAVSNEGHIVAVDSVSPTVFVISEDGDLVHWFDCSEHMREPSDIAINGKWSLIVLSYCPIFQRIKWFLSFFPNRQRFLCVRFQRPLCHCLRTGRLIQVSHWQ